MLQINHIYEFLNATLFKDFEVLIPPNGIPTVADVLTNEDIHVFNYNNTSEKIFIWDQEPLYDSIVDQYIKLATSDKKPLRILVTSEVNGYSDVVCREYNLTHLYYFFHGFAALDWYRGYYVLNANKKLPSMYDKDFISYNRLISDDRSYRNYFVSKLVEKELLDNGLVSYNVANDSKSSWAQEMANPYCKLSPNAINHIKTHLADINHLVIDSDNVPGWASADILRTNGSSFWHVVSETVFYYNKQHLTEKIFKPIVSKQPFMLLAGPGTLEYLKGYGFKTFNSVIDESYDNIQDPDDRINAVVEQLNWYCRRSNTEKSRVIATLAPVIEHNFQHFYGDFKKIIINELISNTQSAFKSIGYNDCAIDYDIILNLLSK
jgi:hypothetical protein